MQLDWNGSVIPGSTVNKRNKVGTEIVVPKSSVSTLPAHSQYTTTAAPIANVNTGTSVSAISPNVAGVTPDTSVLAPSGLAMDNLVSKYSPEQLGSMDFSGYAPGSLGTENASGGLAGLLSGIGGAKGFADIAGGLGALGSLYTGYKQNKMAEQEHDARMGELARQRQRDQDWQRDIKASGLGSYSAGMGVK